MMTVSAPYADRRAQLEEYFDRTAAEAWAALTSDAPVGSIRATVRAGRDRMRGILLGYLPDDLAGVRVLDAGCGTGALAREAAARGAEVVAIDLSPTLVALAQERVGAEAPELRGRIDWRVGDMKDPALGDFDWVVAMDSFIHYQPEDLVGLLGTLVGRARGGLAFTFAPRTPTLAAMHAVGKAFPRQNRAPDIVPISEKTVRRLVGEHDGLAGVGVGRTERVKSGFYTSQAMELTRS